jgi:hypothetical protein
VNTLYRERGDTYYKKKSPAQAETRTAGAILIKENYILKTKKPGAGLLVKYLRLEKWR